MCNSLCGIPTGQLSIPELEKVLEEKTKTALGARGDGRISYAEQLELDIEEIRERISERLGAF